MLKKIMVAALALTFALGFASIAAAADVKVGGSLRTEITWAYYDDEASATGDSNFVFDQFHISSSRLHFTYLSDDKKFKGYAELRLRSRSAGLNVDVRHAYFSYSWDGGSILFGQTGGMCESYFPSQWLDAANSIIGYGKLWFDRLEQIRLTLGDKYKLKIAIEGPTKRNNLSNVDGDASVSYRYFPAFAAALDLNFGNVNVYPWIRWEWERAYVGDEDVNWHSLDFGLEINGDFGLVGFTVAAGYGINSSSAFVPGPSSYPVFDAMWDERADYTCMNVFGELRVGGLSLGGGYQSASMENLNDEELWADDPWTCSVYANYKIPFGKITFIPEIVWECYGDDYQGIDQGNAFKVGLFAMLNF